MLDAASGYQSRRGDLLLDRARSSLFPDRMWRRIVAAARHPTNGAIIGAMNDAISLPRPRLIASVSVARLVHRDDDRLRSLRTFRDRAIARRIPDAISARVLETRLDLSPKR